MKNPSFIPLLAPTSAVRGRGCVGFDSEDKPDEEDKEGDPLWVVDEVRRRQEQPQRESICPLPLRVLDN